MTMASDSSLISSFTRLSTDVHSSVGVLDAFQNEQALLSLMDKTGYSMIQENGQRKYGPPPGWEGPAPPRGCEIFVGKIPRDCYEDELVPIFERIGKIYELRLMMDFSGSNRGYAFVMYTSKADAQRAVREMNNYEIRKGRLLGVCQSVDNCRLFVGGIPKNKTKEEIMSEMTKVTEEVVDVIVYPSANDKTKNRGFAFVEYESHRAAAMARRKLIPGRIQLWGNQIAVDWAEPESEVDEDIMKTVKILYVRNLMLTTSEDHLEEVFNQAGGGGTTPESKVVERVKKLKDYAFIHFREREQALCAMSAVNGTLIEGSKVEVVLAKPVDKNDPARQKNKPVQLATPLMPNMIPALPYDPQTLSAYYAQIGAIPQSEDAFYRGYPTLAANQYAQRGLGRTPMRGRGRGAAGSRAAGSARVYGTRRKTSSPPEHDLNGLLNSWVEASQIARLTLQRQNLTTCDQSSSSLVPSSLNARLKSDNKLPVEVLEGICQRNGWGLPIYQLNSTLGRDGNAETQLFLFKVVIPGLANASPSGGTFVPNKVCRTVDEAQNCAAEYVMMSLGMPYDGTAALAGYPAGLEMAAAQAMPMPMGTFGYLGQPIAAQPYINPAIAAGADLTALTAAYAMQGLPIANTGLISPTQSIMFNGDKPATVQNPPTDLAAYAALAAAPSATTAAADIQAFAQY